MKDAHISQEQFGALLWAGALAPVIELLPVVSLETAGRGAWLSPLVAVVILVPFFWRVGKLNGGILGARERLGKVLGTGFLLIYLGWLELLLALRLGLCARRMLISGERDGAISFFLVTLAVLALWMATGKLTSFARAGQLFLTVLVGTGAVVLLLSVPEVRPDWILPLWKYDTMPVLRSSIPVAGTILWSVLPVLCVRVEDTGKRNLILWWGVGGCIVLTGMQAVILGNLGVGLASRTASPFFALTKSVGVEGAFQRVESVVAALWLLADLTLIVTMLFAIRQIAGIIIPPLSSGWVVTGALALAFWAAMTWCGRGEALEQWNQSWVLAGNLALGFGGTTLLYIGSIIRQKVKGWSIFSRPRNGKNGKSGRKKKG